jgi:hypothetical protein
LIIDHNERELEVLLFYRKDKYEFEGAGFKYEGQFEYVSHKNTTPTRFKLRRVGPKDGVK